MKNLVNYIIPKLDKLQHFYLWLIFFYLTIFVFDFINYLTKFNFNSYLIAIFVVNLSAVYKEVVIDFLQKKGKFELLDIFFSILIPNIIYFY